MCRNAKTQASFIGKVIASSFPSFEGLVKKLLGHSLNEGFMN